MSKLIQCICLACSCPAYFKIVFKGRCNCCIWDCNKSAAYLLFDVCILEAYVNVLTSVPILQNEIADVFYRITSVQYVVHTPETFARFSDMVVVIFLNICPAFCEGFYYITAVVKEFHRLYGSILCHAVPVNDFIFFHICYHGSI